MTSCAALDERFEELVAFAARHNGPPPGFLTYRRQQLELALGLSRVDVRGKRVVEVGGGVSGQSFLLSGLADQVVCTDLLNVESIHGGGLAEAAAIREIGRGGLFFVCGRAEALPLIDSSADVVFSSYVLEHVDDRRAAAREVRRILRPEGHAVILVPNVMETILRTLWFGTYYWPRQVLKFGLIHTGLATRFALHFRAPPDFTFPTHGSYPGYWAELAESRIGEWDELFREHGFEIVRRFSMRHEQYIAFFSSALQVALQGRLLRLVERFGASRPLVWLGPSYGLVARPLRDR